MMNELLVNALVSLDNDLVVWIPSLLLATEDVVANGYFRRSLAN